MKRVIKILSLILFFAPFTVSAEIIISEIAWMGTSGSANHEWIELQNTGSSSVNLAGWTLKAEDGTPSINLSGSISAGAYALLERPADATPVQHLVIFTGALGNTGEHLVLRDGNGNVIQNLNFSSGWPAGNNTTKETMQWNGSIWITAEATPGAPNAMFDSGSTGNQGTGGQTGQNAGSGSGSSSDSSADDKDDEDIYTIVNNKIRYDKESIEIKVVNSNIPIDTPAKISLWTRDLDGGNIVRGKFIWNMGDGTEFVLNKNENFEHYYEYEGSYVVSVDYYSTYFEGIEPNASHRITVNISNSAVVISKIYPDGGVELRNNSNKDVDLSVWSLVENTGNKFVIPNRTFILAGKSIVFNPRQTKLNPLNVTLLTPLGRFVSSVEKFPSQQVASVAATSKSKSAESKVAEQTTAITQTVGNETDASRQNSLNEVYDNANNKNSKQKGLSVWIILFVVMIVGVSVFVFFVYRKNEDKDNNEEDITDEFELLD